MKIGDKAKGFKFDEGFERMTESMYRYIGVEGTIMEINRDIFKIEFDTYNSWWYPIGEYLVLLREEKLKELGILCDADIK